MRLLAGLLKKFVRKGRLHLYDANGRLHEFGSGEGGPSVTVRLKDRALHRKLFVNPELHAAEAYMDGTLTFDDGSTAHDFLTLFSVNRSGLASAGSQKLIRRVWRGARRWQQSNPLGGAARNVRHHYDLKTDFYRLFLDEGLNYSCAYFRDPETDTLEQAQQAKLVHIAAKLQLEPGMSVAEIGSGWGSLAIHLAREHKVKVTAVNVSPEQIRISRERAEEAGVADLVEFRELDYRQLDGRFDRLVSVGMMEHVGVAHFDEYFGKVRDLLTDRGFALIHAIGRMSPPGTTGPFIRKYIFPGGYVPALSEVFASLERQGLWVADNEILRLHYYFTIRHWRQRFTPQREEAAALYDQRFCRMWEFYLSAVELGFLHGSNMVFQLLLARERDAVPIRRDYMFEAERVLLPQKVDAKPVPRKKTVRTSPGKSAGKKGPAKRASRSKS